MAAKQIGLTPPSGLDPYSTAYYADQSQKLYDTYQIGLTDNAQKAGLAGLTWQDKIGQLDQQLQQQQSQLGDRFASRGLLNSGIYNYGDRPGQSGDFSNLGARQQWQRNAARTYSNATAQQANVNTGYTNQAQELGNTYQDQMNSLQNLENASGANNQASGVANLAVPNLASTINQGIANTLNGASG